MNPILVTGASGQQGATVVRHLLSKGYPVRAMLRDAHCKAAEDLASQGCQVVAADLDQADSLSAALQGVSAAFLVLALSDKDTEIRRGRVFIDSAKQAELPYLLFSAALDANHRSGVAHFDSKYQLIQDLAESGLHHSVLGPGGFMENLLFPQTWNGLAQGELVTPFRVDVPQALVAVDDIGRFAASCLSDPVEKSGEFIPLYSESLSSRQQAEIISQQFGYPVRAKRLPWLQTQLFLGRQLGGMFDYFNGGQAPTPPDNQRFLQALDPITRFADWLARQELPA